MYIYPENLKAKATLWCWNLSDLVRIGIFLALSLIFVSAFGESVPLMASVVYAILTIQLEDYSIMDFIRAACRYFGRQQFYLRR